MGKREKWARIGLRWRKFDENVHKFRQNWIWSRQNESSHSDLQQSPLSLWWKEIEIEGTNDKHECGREHSNGNSTWTGFANFIQKPGK